MSLTTTTSKTQTCGELILAELARSEQALASSDLYERLEMDSGDTTIHRALTFLLREGHIELGEPRLGKRGQMAKTYRVSTPASDSERLMQHLESDLGASTALDQLEPHLDTVSSSYNGDELHVIHAHIPCATASTLADLAAKHTDPVLRVMRQMSHRAPRVTALDSTRLHAMAQCLDAGYRIDPDPTVITWLMELATTLEEMSA